VVEDCGGKSMLKEVRRRFGSNVAKIVDGCTDSYGAPKPPWRQRKEEYLHHLKSADAATRLVSAADKLNNIRSILSDYRQIGDAIWDRFNGGREGTLWYYRALLNEFLRDKPNRLIREYELEVRELETIVNSATSEETVYAAHN
jgi:(p)ppGpp synthase/HD superfamily hydrolase